MAAPALAASGAAVASSACLALSWAEAVYTVGPGDTMTVGWGLMIEPVANTCSGPVVIVTVEVWTTYHAPAVTDGSDKPQRVATYTPGCRFGDPGPGPDSCRIFPVEWAVPPVDSDGTSLLPGYYGQWYPGGDCLPVDPGLELSCDIGACERLQGDDTFLLVTYQQTDGGLVTVKLDTFLSC